MVTSCALLDRSQKLVLRGSQADQSDSPAGAREAVTESSVTYGPVLTPPKDKAKDKTKKKSTSAASGKAVKNKKQKDKTKDKSQSGVSVKELDEARREVALEEQEANAPGRATAAGKSNLKVEHKLPSDFTINGEWTVDSVRDKNVTGEERPYVTFDLAAGRFYGSNGCNYLNGNISLDGPRGTLVLSDIIATMSMCDDAPFEYLINMALGEVKSYAARQQGSVTYLDLKSAGGRVVMVLRRHNMDFLNGAWRITMLNGTPMEEGGSITIDVTDLKIHGNTGCNIFNGTLFIDPDKVDSAQFADLITTRMSCPDNVRETELLLALEQVESARQKSADVVEMFDTEGNLLLTLERLHLDDDK